MRSKSILNLLFVVIIAASIVISLPVISFASTQAVNDAAANTKLTNIYNRLGNMYDRMAVTNSYLSNIQTYTQNTQTYLQYIYGQLGSHTGYSGDIFMQVVGVQDMVQAVGGQVADVSSKLLTTNNYLSSIDSKSINYTQYIDGIESALNNIGWTNRNITYSYYQTLEDSISQSNAITSNLSARHIYIRVNFTDWDPYNDALNLVFPVIPYFSNSIPDGDMFIDKVYGLSNAANSSVLLSDEDIYFAYNNYQRASTFYLDGIGRAYAGGGANQSSRRTLIFDVTGKQNVYIFGSDSVSAKSLAYGSEDYLKLANYIKIQSLDIDSLKSNLQTLVDVYASPDVIAAKQNQQAYEDQAITDFTGNGSAAASGSDTTNMKNVSSVIKSGLDSGGSVNGALGVFNTSGGLWDWFSQSNYDEINGTQTRSRESEEYIDFYNTNREELERLLQEER